MCLSLKWRCRRALNLSIFVSRQFSKLFFLLCWIYIDYSRIDELSFWCQNVCNYKTKFWLYFELSKFQNFKMKNDENSSIIDNELKFGTQVCITKLHVCANMTTCAPLFRLHPSPSSYIPTYVYDLFLFSFLSLYV